MKRRPLHRPSEKPKDLCSISEYARRRGISEAAIRGRIAAGRYRRDEHYYKKGRRIMLDAAACDEEFVTG